MQLQICEVVLLFFCVKKSGCVRKGSLIIFRWLRQIRATKKNLKPQNDELEDPKTVRLEMRKVLHTRNLIWIPKMMHCNTH